jgi:hypothetical protein
MGPRQRPPEGVNGCAKAHSACSERHVLFPWREWLLTSLLGISAIALVSYGSVYTTAGWGDQRFFHWPTVSTMAQQLPRPDLVHMKTSTGPAYHIFAAILTRCFSLSMPGAQFVTGALVWTGLAAAVLSVTRSLPWSSRFLVSLTVLACPYVLQSTLWMLTDALALALSIVALLLIYRLFASSKPAMGLALGCGTVIALDFAVRQTAMWIALVAVVSIAATDRTVADKCKLATAAVAPSLIVMAALFYAWGGVTPPGMGSVAEGPQPLGLPVGFALWAVFAAPLLLPVLDRITWDLPTIIGASTAGILAAAPALIWKSSFDKAAGRGAGWMWKAIVRHGVDVFDRSLALCALAFMGAAALFILLKVFYSSGLRSHFWILGTSTVFSMLATVPVHSALQKYREIPILSIFPFLVVAVSLLASSTGPRWRSLNFALTIAASVQTVAALGTVVFPVAGYLRGT